jgi:hypothetical protein
MFDDLSQINSKNKTCCGETPKWRTANTKYRVFFFKKKPWGGFKAVKR